MIALANVGCATKGVPNPWIGNDLVDVASLEACPRPSTDTSSWIRAAVPGQRLSVSVPPGLTIALSSRPGEQSAKWGQDGAPSWLSVRQVDLDRVEGLATLWPDAEGPFRPNTTGISCNDCMVTTARCAEYIGGALRYVGIGRMTGWSSHAMAYAAWSLGGRRWQIIEATPLDSSLTPALALLRAIRPEE